MTAEPPGPPPERNVRPRLDRPPADRYRTGADAPQTGGVPGAPGVGQARARPRPAARGTWLAVAVGALGALAVLLVYGVLATTIGLLAIAGGSGFLVGIPLRGGASTRAVVIASAAMVIGIAGGWLVSVAQGGVAGPVDYVAQTLGLLAIVVPFVAGAGAWLATR